MINFPLFVEGILIPLLALGIFVVYKRSKERREYFKHHPRISYLANG